MAFRVQLTPQAIRQIAGLPESAAKALRLTLVDVLQDPYEPMITASADAPGFREAVFGGFGIVEFQPWDDLGVVIIHYVMWAG
ncbi:hypothetical protein GCM10023196_006200 [Actinoallomurus vinaceus]|uniref:Plasmid stabilization protein n=1 Tax=Actinoallomurus vinaceus TaxID=1080074 RepID=A0ABP8U3A0_9ACTN